MEDQDTPALPSTDTVDATISVETYDEGPAATAIEWASQRVNVLSSETVSDKPWATTLRLTTPAGIVFLKILPPAVRCAMGVVEQLASAFPQTVPRLIASDEQRGLLLLADHGGKDLAGRPGETERTNLLRTYAAVQAHCASGQLDLSRLPSIDRSTLLEELLGFLQPGVDASIHSGAQVQADYFLPASECQRYVSLLNRRQALLQAYIERASELPATLNHGDLRPANAAQDSTGNIILYDWDEALSGPAGSSLHALYSGCVPVMAVLQGDALFLDANRLQQPQRELSAYLDSLQAHGYADSRTLKDSIGASSLCGMIHYILSFSRFPRDSKSYRRTVRRNLKRRLTALLDACDYLSIVDDTDVIELADDYRTDGRLERAERLLVESLRRRPEQADAHHLLGDVRRQRQRTNRAIDAYRNSLEISQDNAAVHIALGEIYSDLGDFQRSKRHYRTARSLGAPDAALLEPLTRVNELENAIRDADQPGVVPSISFSRTEIADRQIAADTLHAAETLFRKHGVLHIKDAFDRELLAECHSVFLERYRNYLVNARHDDALRIGDKRFQITVNLQAPYNSPALYANPLVLPLMKALLGRRCVLGCFTSAMSLPGSEDQRLHKDHKHLFYDDPEEPILPSFAITMMVPLVDLNEHVGTTRVKKGTHRLSSEQSFTMPYQTPLVDRGDCYLMDYRLSHHGQANRSDAPRPILSLVYQRPWFRDYINFKNQPTLSLSHDEFQGIPEQHKPLLAWTLEPGPLSDPTLNR